MHRALVLSLSALAACATAAPPPPPSPKPAPAAEAPRTAPPPQVPGISAAKMDPAARPCEDFYAYACGGWLRATEIPADKPYWGSFTILNQQNTERIREILEADAAGRAEAGEPYAQKLGDFYAACMDEAGTERTGVADLRAEWKKLDAVRDGRTLAAAAGRLHAQGIPVLFGFGSAQDAKDSTRVLAQIPQGGLSLPDRDYYLKDDPQSAAIRKEYLAYVEKLLALAGVKPAQAAREARAIFALEKAMAESHWTRVELREPERIYHPHDLAALQARTPHFPWKAFLEAVGAPGVVAFDVTTPQALGRIDALVTATPAAAWRAYLRWNLLRRMAGARALPRAFVDETFAFVSKAFSGAKEQRARWEHCVDATEGALPEAVGQAFVRRWFGGDAKDKALQLVVDVQKAQGENLATLTWMDDATRGKAREKLARIQNKIGYPAKWRDYAALEVTRASHLENALAAAAFETRRDLAKVGKPLDRTEWAMPPAIVNAQYDAQMNEMTFPAGILQPPFYHRGANDAVNYGAVGFVVGHELTHGFDDEGRKYDAAGNLTDWWSPSVEKEFERRAACVEKQYDAYPAVDEVKVNGKLTLGENIADLGGLKLALAAYRASRQGAPPEAAVDGLGPDQQFFVAAAQVWCSKDRPQFARWRATVDPHSPDRWRVNGPLSNLPEFAEAFACKAGDPMVRAERCAVW